jgi:hypothetical protein
MYFGSLIKSSWIKEGNNRCMRKKRIVGFFSFPFLNL